MLKKQLIELLKDIDDETDINETILSMEDFAKSSTKDITLEDFKELLANNKVVNAYYTSSLDSARSKAVETYKTGKGQEAINKAVEEALKNKGNEGLSEAEIQLKELQAKFEAMEKEKTRAEMSAKYSKVLGEKGLSTDLIDFVLADTDELTTANIDKIGSIINNVTNNKVKEKVYGNSYKQEGTDTDYTGGKITWEQYLENPTQENYIKYKEQKGE